MTSNTILMDQSAINRSLSRIAHEILERNKGTDHLAFIGIRSRGTVSYTHLTLPTILLV